MKGHIMDAMTREEEDQITGLFETYASGFDDFDADAIADHFAYPCTIWQFGKGNVFADREELLENIEALFSVFEREDIVHSSFRVIEKVLTGHVAMVTLEWQQEREGGDVALEFVCHYALIESPEGLAIATVFNEDP
jgi:ketosteroid isomerase-like protein